MSELPPLYRDQRQVDANHLKWLAIGHFVGAGLAVPGLLFILGHFAIFSLVFSDPKLWQNQRSGPPPAAFFALAQVFYLVFGLWYAMSGVLNLLSGLFIRARKHRMFSLIVAGINCFHTPIGTVLGVFTFVVLLRSSVRELYP